MHDEDINAMDWSSSSPDLDPTEEATYTLKNLIVTTTDIGSACNQFFHSDLDNDFKSRPQW